MTELVRKGEVLVPVYWLLICVWSSVRQEVISQG